MELRNLIQNSPLTRAEICRRAGFSRSYLSLLEAGERRVGLSKVSALADALGVGVGDLRPDLAELLGPHQPLAGEGRQV
ncbi:helix-turn-helix domain-containing protein [Pseudooceanicola nanhaiensis]|uniref:helix-turn-helix domain-containing protein n=1 Tax=Pseudooceanicola nanhaiensis TaxID=375761 RepID=UPI001CD708C3|nr:helix-turn-helix domain-containing protein [Pseudooceanicola nanhaiensis]